MKADREVNGMVSNQNSSENKQAVLQGCLEVSVGAVMGKEQNAHEPEMNQHTHTLSLTPCTPQHKWEH